MIQLSSVSFYLWDQLYMYIYPNLYQFYFSKLCLTLFRTQFQKTTVPR